MTLENYDRERNAMKKRERYVSREIKSHLGVAAEKGKLGATLLPKLYWQEREEQGGDEVEKKKPKKLSSGENVSLPHPNGGRSIEKAPWEVLEDRGKVTRG